MVQSIQRLVDGLRPRRRMVRAEQGGMGEEPSRTDVVGTDAAPVDMPWALSGFAELDREGRVLRFQGHDHDSRTLKDLVEGHDLFREVAPAFEAHCLGKRYRTIARSALQTRFAETIDVRIGGAERHVHVVLNYVPALHTGQVFIRTFNSLEAA
jgi:hypothetical protein